MEIVRVFVSGSRTGPTLVQVEPVLAAVDPELVALVDANLEKILIGYSLVGVKTMSFLIRCLASE